MCHGHSRPINEIQFSDITEDGYFVISASKDGKPMLRNGESGDWIGTFEGHNGCVWGVGLDGEATRAVTASADFSAGVWDALTGEQLHTFAHKHIVRTCGFAKVCGGGRCVKREGHACSGMGRSELDDGSCMPERSATARACRPARPLRHQERELAPETNPSDDLAGATTRQARGWRAAVCSARAVPTLGFELRTRADAT